MKTLNHNNSISALPNTIQTIISAMLYNNYNYFSICIIITLQILLTTGDVLINKDEMKLRRHLFRQLLSKHQQTGWFLPQQFPALNKLKKALDNIWTAIKHPENKRLESISLKAWKGEPVKIVVYGGSNSAAGLFPIILQQWWEKNITPISGSVLKVKNIAIGGTSSTYFQFCYDIYLDENEIVDLFILEVSVNDALYELQDPSIPKTLPLEQFLRQLLNRSYKPGIIFVNLYVVTSDTMQCLNLMDFGQDQIIDYYKITAIDLRDLVCSPNFGKYCPTNKTYDFQGANTTHMNSRGHAQIAFMIIQVLMRNIIKNVNILKKFSEPCDPEVPFNNISLVHERKTSRIWFTKPLCWANLTPNYKSNELRTILRVNVVKSNGFIYDGIVRIIKKVSYSSAEERRDAYGGFIANENGSEITISFTVMPGQQLCSVGIISRSSINAGEVDVWFDRHYTKRTNINLHKTVDQTIVRIISTQITSGNHVLTMRVVQNGTAALVGVFVGPYA